MSYPGLYRFQVCSFIQGSIEALAPSKANLELTSFNRYKVPLTRVHMRHHGRYYILFNFFLDNSY